MSLERISYFFYYSNKLPLGPLWHYCRHKQQQSSSYIHSSFPSGTPKNAGKSEIRNQDHFIDVSYISYILVIF